MFSHDDSSIIEPIDEPDVPISGIRLAARLSRLKSKARPAERHLGVLWKPQRFVQLRIVKNVPEMIDDLAISPKPIRKHKLDRSQHECEKCVVAVQQRGFYRRRTDEIA